jgi:hypothetical protein
MPDQNKVIMSKTKNPLFADYTDPISMQNQFLSQGALDEINRFKTPSAVPSTPPMGLPTPINKRPQSNNFFDFLEYPEIDRNQSPMPSPAVTSTPPMGLPMPPPQPEQDDSSNFLGSLIAQGVAGIGTGLMGGSAFDIQRSAGMFDSMRSQQASRDRAKLLMDPKSKESEARRKAYKAVGLDVPDTFSYTDLNDPTVLQGLKGQAEQRRLATMPRQGGAVGGVGKPEKEKKSNEKLLGEYTAHAQALQSSINTIEAVKKLNRSRIGKFTPDFSTDTQASSGTMDRAAAGLIKVLAGPGTVSDSDSARLGGLVPNSNMTKDLAYKTTQNQTLEGTEKALAGLRIDRDLGRINETDYKKIINQYNRYLKDPKLELNKQINIDTGEIEDISIPNKVKFSEEQ